MGHAWSRAVQRCRDTIADALDNRREPVGQPFFTGVEIDDEVGRADLAEAKKRIDESGGTRGKNARQEEANRDKRTGYRATSASRGCRFSSSPRQRGRHP